MKMVSSYLTNRGLEYLEINRKDKKVVFTNGCFDILHLGHITLLNEAKSLGDILVVGINSDNSIKQIKGKNRPIIDEAIRANTLRALPMVDIILIFDEITPIDLIKRVRPDILVKGQDWKGKIVGEDFVKENGGEVVMVNLINGISTTEIINRCYNSIRSL